MSARRRGRGKGGQNANGNAHPQEQGAGGASAKGGGQGKVKKRLVDFWDVKGADLSDLEVAVSVPDDPTALVRSLGAPALPGQGANAEHYFTAVYDKASHVAYALAVANGLLAGEEAVAGEDARAGAEPVADGPATSEG